jgi:hypothetical protein
VAKRFEQAVASCGASLGPGAGGTVHVNLRVGADGRVAEACAETDDTASLDVRGCVIAAAKKLRFAAPDGGAALAGLAALVTGKPVRPLCDP